jgi:SAM-dependent methyltransferase
MRAYYRTEYRPQPTHMNLVTTTRKLNYIKLYLKPWLDAKEKLGVPLVCGDVGCATGYIPAFLRARGHRATGSEWALYYRRFAESFYAVPITEELESKHKYDLITMYHTLEHMMEPDKKLMRYAAMLAEGGRMLVSTPEWFNTLEEASGANIESFPHLFHKDHINVFSATALKAIIAKAGLEIEREDHITYGQTYFLKKGDGVFHVEQFIVPWEETVEKIEKAKVAIDFLRAEKWHDAIATWPKCPEAYLGLIFRTPAAKDPGAQEKIFADAFLALPENNRVRIAHAVWLYSNGRYNECIAAVDWVLAQRPNEDLYMYKGWSLQQLGQHRAAMACFFEAQNMNPMKWVECMNLICKEAVMEPCWEERAMEEVKKQLLDQAKPTVSPIDPVFDGTDKAQAAAR